MTAPVLGPTARQLETLPLEALRAGGEALVDRIGEEGQPGSAGRPFAIGAR